MDWFWHAIWICLVVIPVTILWIVAIFDVVFRRHDLSAGARIAILIMVLLLPAIGALIYFGTMHRPEVPDEYRGPQADREPIQYQTFKAV
jgi:amino acid transporter